MKKNLIRLAISYQQDEKGKSSKILVKKPEIFVSKWWVSSESSMHKGKIYIFSWLKIKGSKIMSTYIAPTTHSNNPTFNQEGLTFKQGEWEDLTFWYLNAEEERILQLELALAKNDFEQLTSLAEQISEQAECFGFERISLLGKKLESATLDKNVILITCLIASLKACVKNLFRRIDSKC